MATSWTIEVVPAANREIRALHNEAVKREALEAIADLREEVLPFDVKTLRGLPGLYRIPFGDHRYRIIYQLSPRKRLIRVLRVRHRSKACQGLLSR